MGTISKPDDPISPYSVFVKWYSNQFGWLYPETPFNWEDTKNHCRNFWENHLTADQRMLFENEAAQDQERYRMEMDLYNLNKLAAIANAPPVTSNNGNAVMQRSVYPGTSFQTYDNSAVLPMTSDYNIFGSGPTVAYVNVPSMPAQTYTNTVSMVTVKTFACVGVQTEKRVKKRKRIPVTTVTVAVQTGHGKLKKAKDPNAPKRATPAFFWFCQDYRAKVNKRNPKELTRELGRLWGNLEPEEKDKYMKLGEKDRQRYFNQKAAYEARNGVAVNSGSFEAVGEASGSGMASPASPAEMQVTISWDKSGQLTGVENIPWVQGSDQSHQMEVPVPDAMMELVLEA